jgi:hypothetical protein
MRKIVLSCLAVALVAGALAAPAAAKKKQKPVETTLFLHTVQPLVGDADAVFDIAEGQTAKMDANPPTSPISASRSFNAPVGNDQCSGNTTFFPTWVGNLEGKIVGDATLTAHFASAPTKILARIWTDTPLSSCNESFIPAASEVEVAIPAGQNSVDIVFPKLNLPAQATIMIELLTRTASAQGRVLYDSTTHPSALTFKCIPASGKSCTP